MTDEEIILLAAKSGRELALTEHAFDGLKVAIIEEITASAWEHAEKRERLFVALKTLSMVRQALEGAVAAGETGRAMLAYRESLATSGLTRP